ncbi:TniQ protein [Mitsuaria sp. PDC51]|nr:TniQ protein [Mitsuaria sp. PDC51]
MPSAPEACTAPRSCEARLPEGDCVIRLAPIQVDETLSSWLLRSAVAARCEPLTLTGVIWPGWRAWTVDLDRGLSDARLDALHRACGVDAERIRACEMRDLLRPLGASLSHAEPVWPWLAARGMRNRRNAGGQPFCPECLASDVRPYLRRAWRAAWNVGCLNHGCELLEHCCKCLAVHQPFRDTPRPVSLTSCWNCQFDHRSAIASRLDPWAAEMQARADTVLKCGTGALGSLEVATPAWFGVLQHCVRLKQPKELMVNGNPPVPIGPGLRFELLSVRERHLRLGRVASQLAQMTSQDVSCLLAGPQHPRSGEKRRSPTFRPNSGARPAGLVRQEWARLLRRMHRAYL